MASYIDITETETDPGAYVTSELLKKVRDNPIAMGERATGSPLIFDGWYPYNQLAIGDGNTGTIWDSSINGNVKTIQSPNFEVGYSYLLRLIGVGPSSASLEVYRGGAWQPTGITDALGSTLYEFHYPLIPMKSHTVVTAGGVGGLITFGGTSIIIGVRLVVPSGYFTAGSVRLYRKGGML